jgi:hypothetical protein
MYIDVGGDSNQIYYNMCYQTNDGIDIYGNSNLVYNNTIYNCRYQAIGLSPTEAGSPDSNIIKNNILHTAANNHMVLAAANTAGTSNVIDNNVLYDAAGGNIVAWASTAENWGNMTFAQWQAHSKYDLHSVNADPLFVSTSDFHLQAGSPAINTGVDVGLTTDYAGHTVPIGPYPDIGAYEADYIPNAFTFTDITGATRTTDYVSNSITVAGTDTASAITITGGTYSKNAAAYTSNAGTVVATDTVTVKVASSGSYSTAVNAALTIGTVSDTYTVTTGSAPASGQNFMSPGNFLRKPKGIF